MRWKPIFAVLLGLLMVGVTAGSAAATGSTVSKKQDPVKPEDVIGVPPDEYWKITWEADFILHTGLGKHVKVDMGILLTH